MHGIAIAVLLSLRVRLHSVVVTKLSLYILAVFFARSVILVVGIRLRFFREA